MKKTQKGITLIALIITIVVLLILAVVAIGAVRDSNIIAHAENAGSDYTIAQEKEQIGLAVSEWQIQKTISGNTLSFFDVVNGALDDVATVVDNNNGTLTITFDKTDNVYVVDENGNIIKQEDDDDNDDPIINDFEIEVSQTPNGSPVSTVTLNIRPIIPDSWNERVFTDEDEAAQYVAKANSMYNTDGTIPSNLKQLLIAGGNTMPGLPKQFAKDEYDEMMEVISTVTDEDISTPQKAFVFMMGETGLSYATVQEWATDIYQYEPTDYSVKIRKNGGEWIDLKNGNSWNYITYQVTTNGNYEIQMELDDKKSIKPVKVTDISYLGEYVKYDANGNGSVEDETILWRVLRDDADKVELITADALGSVDLGSNSDFDGARYKYNNVIDLLLTECKKVTGITKNIRNVGGPASEEEISISNTVVFSQLETFVANAGDTFDSYEASEENTANGLRVGDTNYLNDYNQMGIAGVAAADNILYYWLASRIVYEETGYVDFNVRVVSDSGNCDDFTYIRTLCKVVNSDYVRSTTSELAYPVRPILTLDPGILDNVTQTGTKNDPIEIYQNK